MNTSIKYPIEVSRRNTGRAWHRIDEVVHDGDVTDAMTIDCSSTLIRTTVTRHGEVDNSVSTSLLVVPGVVVAQRWQVAVVEPWLDDEDGTRHPGTTLLTTQAAVISRPELRHDQTTAPGGLPVYTSEAGGRFGRFRWYSADEPMPMPTDEQVYAYLEGLPAPSEVESLRRELDKMRERYLEAEQRVAEAREVKADEDPWIWSDDETAKDVDQLGNTMVVRITGGHLRALISNTSPEKRPSDMPEPIPRRPLDDSDEERARAGLPHYQESDRDYLLNNCELAVYLLDAELRPRAEKSST